MKVLITGITGFAGSHLAEYCLKRGDVDEDLRHAIRSAEAAGYRVIVLPARCRACGFAFDEGRLSKPSKCPACRSTRLFEPQIRLQKPGW